MQKTAILLLLFASLSCTSKNPRTVSEASVPRVPASVDAIDQVYLTNASGYGIMEPQPRECRLSCDEVELWAGVRKAQSGEEGLVGHPQTVLDLLQIIKQRRPEFFRNYTLAYESFSLQEGSFENPRVLAYSCDGKAILTYNGKLGQKGYERLEFSCFNDRDKTFEFKEMTFPKDAANSSDLADLTAEQKLQPVVLSPINGSGERRCTLCHGQPAKPIWESYNLWPRFYGGFDDNLQRSSAPEFVKWEQGKLAAYLQKSRPFGRYQPLIDRVANQYGEYRPNDFLGTKLYNLNGERIVAELKRIGKPFQKRVYRFARALLCNQSPEGLGVLSLNDKVSPRAREILMMNYEDTANKLRYFEQVSKLRISSAHANDDYWRAFFYNKFARFYPKREYLYQAGSEAEENYYVAENGIAAANLEKIVAPVGIEIQNWSLSLNGSYVITSGQAGPFMSEFQSMLERPFAKTFLSQDTEFIDALMKYREVPWESGGLGGANYPLHDRAWENLCQILEQRISAERTN